MPEFKKRPSEIADQNLDYGMDKRAAGKAAAKTTQAVADARGQALQRLGGTLPSDVLTQIAGAKSPFDVFDVVNDALGVREGTSLRVIRTEKDVLDLIGQMKAKLSAVN